MAALAVAALPASGRAQASTGAMVSAVAAVSYQKCLDVPNSNTADGTRLEIWDCNGGANQQVSSTSIDELRVLGKCLDDLGGRGQQGDAVVLATCNYGQSQKWAWDSKYKVYRSHLNSMMCLDVTGASTANGALLELWGCNYGSNQQWSIPGGSWSRYSAMMTDDGRCVWANANGAGVQNCADLTNAVWFLAYNSASNFFQVEHRDGAGITCLSAPNASMQVPTLKTCDGSQGSQRFYFKQQTGQLQLVGTSLCLNISGGQRGVSTQVIMYDCSGAPWNERFAFALLIARTAAQALGWAPPNTTYSTSTSLSSFAANGLAKALNTASIVGAGAGNIITNLSGAIQAQPASIVGAGAGNIIGAGAGNIINSGAFNLIAATGMGSM